MQEKLRIGVVNWDAGLPSDKYMGNFMITALGKPQHANRLPYYAIKKDDDKYEIPIRTQDDYDKELAMAADAGIDFFMYCWYSEGKEKNPQVGEEKLGAVVPHLPWLNTMRKLYQKSPLNKRIKMCAILLGMHAYSKEDILLLVDAMKQDYYEKKDGRPLLFVFGGYRPKFFSQVRELINQEGLNPYIVFMHNGLLSENGDYSEADAVGAYGSGHGAKNFEELTEATEKDNQEKKQFGLPIIPLLSAGWDPTPRIDTPCPWFSYPRQEYSPAPTVDQMEKATLKLFKWIEKTPEANTGYATVFAWNEFEEGGYICPTLKEDGKPCTDILDGLARALKTR